MANGEDIINIVSESANFLRKTQDRYYTSYSDMVNNLIFRGSLGFNNEDKQLYIHDGYRLMNLLRSFNETSSNSIKLTEGYSYSSSQNPLNELSGLYQSSIVLFQNSNFVSGHGIRFDGANFYADVSYINTVSSSDGNDLNLNSSSSNVIINNNVKFINNGTKQDIYFGTHKYIELYNNRTYIYNATADTMSITNIDNKVNFLDVPYFSSAIKINNIVVSSNGTSLSSTNKIIAPSLEITGNILSNTINATSILTTSTKIGDITLTDNNGILEIDGGMGTIKTSYLDVLSSLEIPLIKFNDSVQISTTDTTKLNMHNTSDIIFTNSTLHDSSSGMDIMHGSNVMSSYSLYNTANYKLSVYAIDVNRFVNSFSVLGDISLTNLIASTNITTSTLNSTTLSTINMNINSGKILYTNGIFEFKKSDNSYADIDVNNLRVRGNTMIIDSSDVVVADSTFTINSTNQTTSAINFGSAVGYGKITHSNGKFYFGKDTDNDFATIVATAVTSDNSNIGILKPIKIKNGTIIDHNDITGLSITNSQDLISLNSVVIDTTTDGVTIRNSGNNIFTFDNTSVIMSKANITDLSLTNILTNISTNSIIANGNIISSGLLQSLNLKVTSKIIQFNTDGEVSLNENGYHFKQNSNYTDLNIRDVVAETGYFSGDSIHIGSGSSQTIIFSSGKNIVSDSNGIHINKLYTPTIYDVAGVSINKINTNNITNSTSININTPLLNINNKVSVVTSGTNAQVNGNVEFNNIVYLDSSLTSNNDKITVAKPIDVDTIETETIKLGDYTITTENGSIVIRW